MTIHITPIATIKRTDYQHNPATGAKTLTAGVVDSELWTTPAPVTIYCTPLPANPETRLNCGPAYNHFAIVLAGAVVIEAISCLHLHLHPLQPRAGYQANQAAKTAPVNPAYDQLLAENPALHAQAVAVWRDYQNFLIQHYNTNFCQRVRSQPAAIANALEQILSAYVQPTSFDTGVRCKSRIRLLAMKRGGPALANFLSVGMQAPSYLSYLAHCSATIELTAKDIALN